MPFDQVAVVGLRRMRCPVHHEGVDAFPRRAQLFADLQHEAPRLCAGYPLEGLDLLDHRPLHHRVRESHQVVDELVELLATTTFDQLVVHLALHRRRLLARLFIDVVLDHLLAGFDVLFQLFRRRLYPQHCGVFQLSPHLRVGLLDDVGRQVGLGGWLDGEGQRTAFGVGHHVANPAGRGAGLVGAEHHVDVRAALLLDQCQLLGIILTLPLTQTL